MSKHAIAGIYCFENRRTGKKYIGQSIDVDKRINQHLNLLRKGKDLWLLQRAWNKYGEDGFVWFVIEKFDVSLLNAKEMQYIKSLNSKRPNGYNLTDGGETTAGQRKEMVRVRNDKSIFGYVLRKREYE